MAPNQSVDAVLSLICGEPDSAALSQQIMFPIHIHQRNIQLLRRTGREGRGINMNLMFGNLIWNFVKICIMIWQLKISVKYKFYWFYYICSSQAMISIFKFTKTELKYAKCESQATLINDLDRQIGFTRSTSLYIYNWEGRWQLALDTSCSNYLKGLENRVVTTN